MNPPSNLENTQDRMLYVMVTYGKSKVSSRYLTSIYVN